MALKVTVTDAKQIGPGIWSFEMPPHQLRHFGAPSHAIGKSSVVLLGHPEYDPACNQLQIDVDDVTPINVGTTNRVFGISTGLEKSVASPANASATRDQTSYGPGDREFLRLAKLELSDRMANVAEKLLSAVRQKSPGELKRGKSRNFSETPDNFWYIIIQPRIDELSVTVRGTVEHFSSVANLEIKDDRGNTRFKVNSEKDIAAALDLIFHAQRKR